ncbi:hypothetical protein BmR1_04g06580 [Babesia microti strain RI]|uniref:K Homology domain-containing protein n=1 Tax=Babesia microti (strain RI) TaxID=1133968 RepID=I7J8P2_BABMR|nr:hypothetical protein BmR1_04g06580 [Babesia microti strain RI]CCF75513.1 hypothetical protein BmR1_04g06580 [Babesia microti strain RI]|eukprot:XP_012649921.1 hypothetical protein BmR1_04g06580 [Babesia microti strain RI]
MALNYSPFSSITWDWTSCSLDQSQSQHCDLKFRSSSNLNQTSINKVDQSNKLIDIHNTYTKLNKFDLPDSNTYLSYNNSTDSNIYTATGGKIKDIDQLKWQIPKNTNSHCNARTKVNYSDPYSYEHSKKKFNQHSQCYSPLLYKKDITCTFHNNDNNNEFGSYTNNKTKQNTHQNMFQNIQNKIHKNIPQHIQHQQQIFCDSYKSVEVSSTEKLNLPFVNLWDSKKSMFLKILTTQIVSGTIIGKGGKGLNWFRRKSRVDDIHLSMPWEVYPGTEYRTILLRGTIKSVVKAVTMISDLMTHKSESEFCTQGASTCIFVLIVLPDILLPKVLELKSAYSPKFVSIVPYNEPDFNEIVVSFKGDRQLLRNIISYFVHLIDQIIGITNYCFISYKIDKESNINADNEKFANKTNDVNLQNTISLLSAQEYDNIPNAEIDEKNETSNLNLTLNDLAPDNITSSGTTDGYLHAIDIATSKFTPPSLTYNEYAPEILKDTGIFYSNNCKDGNELFNTTYCFSSSPLLDQSYSTNMHEVSNYPITLSLSLPHNVDLTALLMNYPQFHNLDLPRNDAGQPICNFTGTFNDVFAKVSVFISEIHAHTRAT